MTTVTQLPPGQRKFDGFPRFGGPSSPPVRPAKPALEITTDAIAAFDKAYPLKPGAPGK